WASRPGVGPRGRAWLAAVGRAVGVAWPARAGDRRAGFAGGGLLGRRAGARAVRADLCRAGRGAGGGGAARGAGGDPDRAAEGGRGAGDAAALGAAGGEFGAAGLARGLRGFPVVRA